MRCSLNEITSLSAKATRGAGLPWGIADEAGWAVGWLEARGVPAAAALERGLADLSGAAWRDAFPVPEGAEWQARNGRMDGLLAGITIADRAWAMLEEAGADDGVGTPSTVEILEGDPAAQPYLPKLLPGDGEGVLDLLSVRCPVLLVPFLANFSYFTHLNLQLSFEVSDRNPRKPVRIADGAVSGSCRDLAERDWADKVRIEVRDALTTPRRLRHLDGSIPIDDEAYARLGEWAAKTYVPESAESQARGAGGANLIETD